MEFNKKNYSDRLSVEIESLAYQMNELNEYIQMLVTGKHNTDYIVGKIQTHTHNINALSRWIDGEVKEEKIEWEKQNKEKNE